MTSHQLRHISYFVSGFRPQHALGDCARTANGRGLGEAVSTIRRPCRRNHSLHHLQHLTVGRKRGTFLSAGLELNSAGVVTSMLVRRVVSVRKGSSSESGGHGVSSLLYLKMRKEASSFSSTPRLCRLSSQHSQVPSQEWALRILCLCRPDVRRRDPLAFALTPRPGGDHRLSALSSKERSTGDTGDSKVTLRYVGEPAIEFFDQAYIVGTDGHIRIFCTSTVFASCHLSPQRRDQKHMSSSELGRRDALRSLISLTRTHVLAICGGYIRVVYLHGACQIPTGIHEGQGWTSITQPDLTFHMPFP